METFDEELNGSRTRQVVIVWRCSSSGGGGGGQVRVWRLNGERARNAKQPARQTDRQTDSSTGEPVTVCRSAAANQVKAVLGVVFASRT